MSESTAQRNKTFVLEAFDTLFNKKDFVAAEKFWSPNYIQHSAHIPPGRDGLFALVKSAPPGMKYELNGTRRQFLGLATAAGAALFAASAPAFATSKVFMMDLPPASAAIAPFKINIPNAAVKDLKYRLRNARYPEKETIDDTSQGPQLSNFIELMDYWRSEYDWRRCERMLSGFPQFRTKLDGLGIHFIHVRSRHENALPMILTHGWPGSIVEFYKVIEPLVNPTAFGGNAKDAFHVVIPSLPGFGFSDKPTAPGWNVARIARAWDVLMERLGYSRYVAQGGDWGAVVTTRLAEAKPEGLAAIHLNFPIFIPPPLEGMPTEEEKAAIAQAKHFFDQLSGYSSIQKTRPQTIGYALTDSPVGQAAWIYDRFITSTDSHNHPELVLTKDEMLDDIMIYWLTATAASSSRLYWESFKDLHHGEARYSCRLHDLSRRRSAITKGVVRAYVF